jgi:hypothetical protein
MLAGTVTVGTWGAVFGWLLEDGAGGAFIMASLIASVWFGFARYLLAKL